jgi:quercetin dioxygenase-like cupin family protein
MLQTNKRRNDMKNKYWLLVAALLLTVNMSLAQQKPPTMNKGLDIKLLQANNLGPQIEGMAGRQLRMRTVTVEPGGVLGVHNHVDRPGVVYILKGTVTEHRGDDVKNYSVGNSWVETKETTHWLENKTKTPVVLLSIDIFKE